MLTLSAPGRRMTCSSYLHVKTTVPSAFPPSAESATTTSTSTALPTSSHRLSMQKGRPASGPVVSTHRDPSFPYDSPSNRIATLRFVQDIPLRPTDPGYDIVASTAEQLHRFEDTPALVLWGEKDFVFDAPFLREWERHLPRAAVHRFADCGHYVLEDATDEIVAEVKRFLGV